MSKDGAWGAEHAAEVLGTMRGIAAKIGQMASYVDGVVPDEHRAAYETALGTLRTAAPVSSPQAIRDLIIEELSEPPEKLFAHWEEKPFASASIGQVHRATLHDGRQVAVKVQHPGIKKAVQSDLDNAGLIQTMVGSLGKHLESKRILDEVRQRFMEELDYRLEAKRQSEFAELHQSDPHIVVPVIIEDRSSGRVLTSEFVSGKHLEDILAEPEETRRHYAETLWRFVFKGNLVMGMFNADPHPGNYLFQGDGRVAFLDFGCVQPLHDIDKARRLHRNAIERNEAGFREAAIDLLRTRGGVYEAFALDYSRKCFEPLFGSPFRMTREYTVDLVHALRDMKRDIMFPKDKSFVQMPPGMLFMNRLQFGFYSVLARLNVAVDYAAIEREFLY